jgi:hypothetical protein
MTYSAPRKQLTPMGREVYQATVTASGYGKGSLIWSYLATLISEPQSAGLYHTLNGTSPGQKDAWRHWTVFANNCSVTTFRDWLNGKPVKAEAHELFCQVLTQQNPLLSSIGITAEAVTSDVMGLLRSEMCALKSYAIARLNINIDTSGGIAALSKAFANTSKAYANVLNHKNKDFFESKESVVKVSRSQVFVAPPEFPSPGILSLDLSVSVSGGLYQWGLAMVNQETGRGELLLDNRPYTWTGEEVKIGEKKVWKFEATDFKFTKVAIECLGENLAIHNPGTCLNMSGMLKDKNRTIFQQTFLQSLSEYPDWSEDERIQYCYRQTPFGKARQDLGMTDVKIDVLDRDESGIPCEVFVSTAQRPSAVLVSP